MKPALDMDKIARALRAERRGPVAATGGYFGAIQLSADVATRFRMPAGGGQPTDVDWTQRGPTPVVEELIAADAGDNEPGGLGDIIGTLARGGLEKRGASVAQKGGLSQPYGLFSHRAHAPQPWGDLALARGPRDDSMLPAEIGSFTGGEEWLTEDK